MSNQKTGTGSESGSCQKKPEVKVGTVKSKKREGEWGKDTHTGSEIQNSLFFKENLLRPKNYNVTELDTHTHTHTHTHTQEVKFKILFFNENSQEARITSGNVGPDRVSRASHFLFGKSSNNVTDVQKLKQCHRRPETQTMSQSSCLISS